MQPSLNYGTTRIGGEIVLEWRPDGNHPEARTFGVPGEPDSTRLQMRSGVGFGCFVPDDEDRARCLVADAFADAAERGEAVQASASDD